MPGQFTDYTIRILGQGGQPASAMTLTCASDHDVTLAAQVISRPCGMEIWDGDRLVATFPAADARAA